MCTNQKPTKAITKMYFFNGNADQQREYKLFGHFAFCARDAQHSIHQRHQNAFRQDLVFFFRFRCLLSFCFSIIWFASVYAPFGNTPFALNNWHTQWPRKKTKKKKIQTLKSICKLFAFVFVLCYETEEHNSERSEMVPIERRKKSRLHCAGNALWIVFGPLFQLLLLLLLISLFQDAVVFCVLKMIPAYRILIIRFLCNHFLPFKIILTGNE